MTLADSEERTKNYIRQVKGSIVFRGLAVAASFLAVPLMIRYLGAELYGIWSTMLSIMSWIVFFDLGIGNGLRNKLAECLAKQQDSEAVRYISSAYTWIGLFSLLILVVIAISTIYIPWQFVFNTQSVSNSSLRDAVCLASFFVMINFWLGLINQILNAFQRTSSVVLGQLVSNFLALITTIILIQTTKASLYFIVAAYGGSMVLANVLLSAWFYKRHKDYRPNILLEHKHIKPLLSVGLQFFVIQIAVMIIFTTDKILITQLFGPKDVSQYDVVFKLFSCITIIHGLLTAPLWSAYTDAYHRGDFGWIRYVLKKQLVLFIGVVILTIGLIFVADSIIAWWIGRDLKISSSLVLSIGVFIIISIWNNIYAYILNGIGNIKIQLITSIMAMLINIPTSIFLVQYFNFGVEGVVWATCLSLSIFAVVGPFQVASLISKKD